MELQTAVGAVVRTLVASAGGSFVANGLITQDQLTTLSGAAVVVVVLVWSLIQKKLAAK